MTTLTEGDRDTQATIASGAAPAWSARMVAPLSDAGQGTRASFVARDFQAPSGDAPTQLRISAQGLYRAFINGQRVGDDVLTPGWTCYDDRIAFQTYDVTDLLQPGKNRIVILLADGWFRSQMMWRETQVVNCWGDRIAAIAQLESAGAVIAQTDATWQSGLCAVTKAGIYYGEDYDARLDDLSVTGGVEALEFDTGLLVPHEAGAVKELAPLEPVESWQADGGTIYDFGQNASGYVRITVQGEAGAKVRIEHAEILGPDKTFDNRNYRDARVEATYILKGGAPETYAPLFTFMGFRYARLTIEGKATVSKVASIPISSVPEVAGGFTCAVPQVDRLVQNTIWSQRANFIEIPTDCPQRDERMGWTGDAQVFAGTACWLAGSAGFLTKYLRDVRHDQRPDGAVPYFSPDPTRLHPQNVPGDWAGATGWGDVITMMPWQLYLHYGDDTVLRDNFAAMNKWIDYLWALGDSPIVPTHTTWGAKGFNFGDWLQPVGDNRLPRPTISADCIATMFHYISVDLTSTIAGILGERQISADLRARAEKIKAAFAHEFISPSGRLAHNDQTSYALAALYDLIPPQHLPAAKDYFRKVIVDAEYLIGTGFLGTPALLPALSILGMDDLAEQVFLNRKVPGWLYQVDMGATTIWERWDALGPDGTIYAPEMNSYNHYAYGAVCQWLFESVAGVTPTADAPGFDRVTLAPHILPQLSPVAAWHDCRHGRITAGWSHDGNRVTYDVTLPEGCEGVLAAQPGCADYTLNGAPTAIPDTGLILPSGTHRITFHRN